jgi:ADP-ribose pyrophosphatase YjhB (NUDIX family)
MKVQAAGVFLIRKDGKLLVCHPTNHAPNVYSIPKGKIENDETKIEAALRETEEETNINLNNLNGFNIYELESVNYKHGKKILHPFLFLENNDSVIDWETIDIKCNSNVPESRGGFPEMDSYLFVTLKEAETLLHDTQVLCLDTIRKIIKK